MSVTDSAAKPTGTQAGRRLTTARAIAEGIGGLAQAGGVLVFLEGAFMPTQYAPERGGRPGPSSPAPSR